MKTNMTEKDKRLLVIMFIIVIVVGIGYWGILPQIKRYNKLETKIEKEEDQRKVNQQKIMNLAFVEDSVLEYQDKIEERKDEFFQPMTSSEIDRMMTEMAANKGLNIYDLSFTMPSSPSVRMPYEYSSIKEEYVRQISEETGLDDVADTFVGTSDEDDEDEDEDDSEDSKSAATTTTSAVDDLFGEEEGSYSLNTDIYAVPVTMTVGGDMDQLQQFYNELLAIDKRILITSYAWGEYRDVVRRDSDGNIISSTGRTASITSDGVSTSEGAGVTSSELEDVSVEVVTRKSLTVKLEIYMCDTSSVASETDAE